MITSLAPLPVTNSTSTSADTEKVRTTYKTRIVSDFEMGDYVVDITINEKDRVVRRIVGFSGGQLLFEGLSPTASSPATKYDWASEEAIDAAIQAGTVSGSNS